MNSGIIAYLAEQGEYCKLSIYNSDMVEAIFKWMEKAGPPIVNSRISDSQDEIKKIDKALEGILGNVNKEAMPTSEREASIHSVF